MSEERIKELMQSFCSTCETLGIGDCDLCRIEGFVRFLTLNLRKDEKDAKKNIAGNS